MINFLINPSIEEITSKLKNFNIEQTMDVSMVFNLNEILDTSIIIDFKNNYLHILGYSDRVDKILPFSQLKKNLVQITLGI